jgi:hypothetical protein
MVIANVVKREMAACRLSFLFVSTKLLTMVLWPIEHCSSPDV